MGLVELILNDKGELCKATSKKKEKVEVEPLGQPKLLIINYSEFKNSEIENPKIFFKKLAIEQNEFKEAEAFCLSEELGRNSELEPTGWILAPVYKTAYAAVQYYKIK